MNKLFRLASANVIIFNHGINVIKGKEWDSYCSDFESAMDCQNLQFDELVDQFKAFVEDDVSIELSQNTIDDSVGFVFCGVDADGRSFVRELFWKRSKPFEDKPHQGLARTGTGSQYLNGHLRHHPEVNTIGYWGSRRTGQAVHELTGLFAIARDERDNCSGNEFSDDFDIAELTN
jgi:hypothetical protein